MSRLNQKGVVQVLFLLILLGGLAAGIYLVQKSGFQIFQPKAGGGPIWFTDVNGKALPLNSSNVSQTNSPTIKIQFTSTLGPPEGSETVSSPNKTRTVSYRFAEDPDSLKSKEWLPYSVEPTVVTYTFSNTAPGNKFIWAEFKDNSKGKGKTDRRSAQIELISSGGGTGSSFQRVFVTKDTYSGNLGGLAGGDAKCQASADAANLGGTWKAWLSDSTTSASSRLAHDTTPYKLVNGTIIANNWDDLTDGSLANRINADQFGGPIDWPAWTGTNANGGIDAQGRNCNNWTATTADYTASIGYHFYLDSKWTDYGYSWCKEGDSFYKEHLICFEQASTTYTPTPTPTATPKLPDLMVNSIKVLGTARVKGKNSINVTIQNKGNADTKERVTVDLKISQPNNTVLGNCSGTFRSVAVGRNTTVQIRNCPAFKTSGNHTFTATVDSTNVVKESDENNNTLSTTTSVGR